MRETRRYDRVLLKVSGESLVRPGGSGIDAEELSLLAEEIARAVEVGCQIAVVIGGGNIIRGAALAKDGNVPQASADYMGMLGTIINGIALKETLETRGQPTRLMSAINIPAVAEHFIRGRALRHLEKGRVVILAGGTGNPYCTTDTAAALRAAELHCEIILKATKVDGVYTDDPKQNPSATRFDSLTFTGALEQKLRIMDITALSMCMEQRIPVLVFDYKVPDNIRAAIAGESIGTLITHA